MLITGVEPKSTGSPTLSVGTVLVQCNGTFSSQLRNMVLRFYFPERRSGQFYSFQIAKRKTASSRPICIPLLRNLSCKTRYPSAADDPSIFGKFLNHFNVKSSTVFELGTGTFIMIKLIFCYSIQTANNFKMLSPTPSQWTDRMVRNKDDKKITTWEIRH